MAICSRGGAERQQYFEYSAGIFFALRDDSATMPLHDLFADRQTKAGTLILIFRMQAGKGVEDLQGIFFFEAYAIIPDLDAGKRPIVIMDFDSRCNSNDRGNVSFSKFE